MNGKQYLNGCDYLMLGFDYELRRHGFAGNSCQMTLELESAIPASDLQDRLATLAAHYPILGAHPGGVVRPRWKMPRQTAPVPRVRVHRDEPTVRERICNERLETSRGELVRFDLLERSGPGMTLVFTWSHALMDAPGAEQFLAQAGRTDLPLPEAQVDVVRRPRLSLPARCRLAWKSIHHLDRFCEAAPRSLGSRHVRAPARLRHQVEKFSVSETERVRANGVRLCGMLGDAQFHAAVAMLELHALHQRLGRKSPSYVLPLPVGLRPKGSAGLLFSNQVAMLMLQFLPEHLDSAATTVAAIKAQTEKAMRAGLLESGVVLSELFRFLPLPIYMAILKQGLRGEICSIFYGDTAAVNPLLTSFMGVTVNDLTHVAAVTPSPGIGVIFYYFRAELRVTVLHSAKILNDAEAAGFAAGLRARLLNP